MGLDSVELLIEVEKAFDIRIPDSVAEKIITVGDFHNVVWSHLSLLEFSKCNTQILFINSGNISFQLLILIGMILSQLLLLINFFPEINRRKNYAGFENSMQLKLPELVLPKSLNSFLHLIGMLSVGGGLLYALFMAEFYNHSRWNYLIPFAGIVLTSLLSSSLNFKRVIISPFIVREFTEKTLALNYATIASKSGNNRKDVEKIINHIISEKIGLELEEISPEKKIGDDLGVC